MNSAFSRSHTSKHTFIFKNKFALTDHNLHVPFTTNTNTNTNMNTYTFLFFSHT